VGGDVHAVDDAAPRGVRSTASREEGEAVALRLVDVASGPIDDDAGDSAQLRGKGQIASPTRGVDAAALLDHDDVALLARLDGRRAKMTRSDRSTIVRLELHGHYAPGNALVGGEALDA